MLKAQFVNVPAITITINGQSTTAESRQFSTGSCGWYSNGKMVAKAGQSITVNIGGTSHIAEYRSFSTGSMGWNVSGKQFVTLPDGSKVKAQVSFNLTIIGSKEVAPTNGADYRAQLGCSITIVGSKEATATDVLGGTIETAPTPVVAKRKVSKKAQQVAVAAPVAQTVAPAAVVVKSDFDSIW